jgi:NAD(P)-dependent dehydrogenase (short-subunit alcohol dehydrogenase family)
VSGAHPPDLSGKVALVTGAAQGIGRAIGAALRDAGARVAIADVNAESLRETEQSLDGSRDDVRMFVADVADAETASALPDLAHAAFGALHIVVNNAGTRSVHGYLDHPLDAWQRAIAVNLTAPFLICQSAARLMIPSGGGRIVNVASVAAELAFKNRAAYNASKAGLVMLTKSIALELGDRGIRCNAVAPGIVETPINSAYLKNSEITSVILDGTPVGHWGQPEDVAAVVAFLCGPSADFVNGAVVPVDGGWMTGKGY